MPLFLLRSTLQCSFTESSQSHAASRKEFDDRVSVHYGDAFAWIFLGVCVLLIGASFLSPITSGDSAARTLALAKSVFLLLLVLVVWLGTRQRRSQAAG